MNYSVKYMNKGGITERSEYLPFDTDGEANAHAQVKMPRHSIVEVWPGARGDDGKRLELSVAVGDRIVFGKWSGIEVTLGGEDFIIMNEADILGVVGTQQEAKKPRSLPNHHG